VTGGRRLPPALVVAAAAVVAVLCLPLVYLVVRAASGGLDALAVLGRPRTGELVLRTAALVAATVAGAVALGVPAAWLVARTDLPGRRVWAVLLALPLALPSYVLALALLAVSGPGGATGLPSLAGFWGAVAALTASTYPYVFLLCAAALRRTDPALEEAARALGRSGGEVLRSVTLPLLRPTIAAGALLVALYALSDFGVVSLMRVDALTRSIFLQYRSAFDRTPAAVLGLVLVVGTAVLLVVEARARGRAGAVSRPGARSAPPVALGGWTPVALGGCGSIVALSLVLPLAVIAGWLVRRPPALAELALPALNSVAVSAVAAIAATACALPLAVLVVRGRGRTPRVLEAAALSSNALPGVVIALSLVFFSARYLEPLYQTLGLLLLAYLVRFFPQALAGTRTALARADPALEEAARGLGRSPLQALMATSVPLVAPGLLAGTTLVFLSTMKELPASLLLRPTGFDTLPIEVWTATSVSAYSSAAAPALALCLLSAPIVWLLVARGEGEVRG